MYDILSLVKQMGGGPIKQTTHSKAIIFNFPYKQMLLHLDNGTFTFEDGELFSSEEIEFYREQGFQIIYVEEGQTTLFNL